MFANRTDAGCKLAEALKYYRDRNPLVLGLPRGGVVVAAEVAKRIGGELDVLFVKKLGAPENPELAIGAIGEDGKPALNDELVRALRVDADYIREVAAQRLAEIRRQSRVYRAVRKKASPAHRVCILVDDGLATGATMMAAIQNVAAARPAQLIVAVPGGPEDTLKKIRAMPHVDDVICLEVPARFSGVSQLYDEFGQVEDDEVITLLQHFVEAA